MTLISKHWDDKDFKGWGYGFLFRLKNEEQQDLKTLTPKGVFIGFLLSLSDLIHHGLGTLNLT